MSEFVSRYEEGMTWTALVHAWLPGLPDDAVSVLLWEGTCYPIGSREDVERQLAEAASWPSVSEYLTHCYDQQDAAMKAWQDREDGGRITVECETCVGSGSVPLVEVA